MELTSLDQTASGFKTGLHKIPCPAACSKWLALASAQLPWSISFPIAVETGWLLFAIFQSSFLAISNLIHIFVAEALAPHKQLLALVAPHSGFLRFQSIPLQECHGLILIALQSVFSMVVGCQLQPIYFVGPTSLIPNYPPAALPQKLSHDVSLCLDVFFVSDSEDLHSSLILWLPSYVLYVNLNVSTAISYIFPECCHLQMSFEVKTIGSQSSSEKGTLSIGNSFCLLRCL